MRLVEATVDRYGILGGWNPQLTDGLTVLSGPNEAGKSLYLEALLQLMDAGVVDVLEPPPRYDESPVGRVVLEHAGEQYDLGEDGSLSDLTPIQPADLPTVFVVRDNDLAMPEGPDYYTDLVEHLGEIHSSTIESIVGELKDAGRLTDKRLNLSDQHDDAKSTRNDAEDLHRQIEAFLAEIGEEGFDELQRERLRVERRLRRDRSDLADQERAKTVEEYEALRETLETYESASADLEGLGPFTRGQLEELRETERDLDRITHELEDREAEIETTRADLEEKEAELEQVREDESRLERREAAVSQAEDRLGEYRDRSEDAVGADRRVTIGRRATVAGIAATALLGVAGAVTGSTGALVLAALVLVVSVLAGVGARRASAALEAVEQAENRALEAARDAGFDVDEIEAVAPAIEDFRGTLETTRERRVRIEEQHDGVRADLEEAEEGRDRLDNRRDELADALNEEWRSVGVEGTDEFAERVERRETLDADLSLAEQRLVDSLGDPDAARWEDRANAFRKRLGEMVSDIDLDEIDADAYDASQLAELEDRVRELESRREELEADLELYDDKVADFQDRARTLRTIPFLEDPLTIEGRSEAALRTLQSELRELVEAIERDAEISRKAIDIFEGIAGEEERKIAELFDPDGPASRAFGRITAARYTSVEYDTETDRLVVEREDGRQVSPTALSEGTRDQLYFASRLSLAEQILEHEPGFLLLDDPLVGADPDRLHRGFETLVDLADDGWQIVYLTAKGEVAEEMVEAFDLPHEEVDAIV